MENILGTKHTLWSLLGRYGRIEIPIIQRDYAQGRESAEEIRQGILDHILGAVNDKRNEELDFIYGIRQPQDEKDDAKTSFIPIDGQQRLTTLWLIHWYLAHKSGLLSDEEHIEKLRKFTYETRPSSNMFIQCLCKEPISSNLPISQAIVDDAPWFDESWKLDSSVMGFIKMLQAIENHSIIKDNDPEELLTRFKKNEYISFYFLPLQKFGLGEEIYSRMNARGKILTDFEKFKSTFFKIIGKSSSHREIADKIEYDWVKYLWKYRPKGTYVTDIPFMRWLKYISQMLYVEKFGNRNDERIEDFASAQMLEKIYTNEDSLKFLIHCFDRIPVLESLKINFSFEWDKHNGFEESLKWIAERYNVNKTDVMKQLTVWAALLFLYERHDDHTGLPDFLKVVRNLIKNTKDNTLREWPVLIQSIKELISDDVYSILRSPELHLKGFRTEQREIERFKAHIIGNHKGSKDLIQSMDDHPALRGRLTNIFIECMEPVATDSFTLKLRDICPTSVDLDKLGKIFKAYGDLYSFENSRDFNGIRGDIINTKFYDYDQYNCWYIDGSSDNYSDYTIHPVIMKLARDVAENAGNSLKTILNKEKNFVRKMVENYNGHLENVNNPKEQLYLLYIISSRILKLKWYEFFACERFNFSWVASEAGYCTPFNTIGSLTNYIFQTYKSYLKGDYIVSYRTPHVLFADWRDKNLFQRLWNWAEN